MKTNTGVRWAWRLAIAVTAFGATELAAHWWARGGQQDPAIYAAADAAYTLAKGYRGTLWTGLRAVSITIDDSGRRTTTCDGQAPPSGDRVPVHVVGDSQVFGWGLSDCESIPARLQLLLGPGYKVVNHGVPGYGPYQYEDVIAALPPNELVIAVFTAQNDLWDLYQRNPKTPVVCGRLLSPESWFAPLPCPLLDSQALQLAVHAIKDTPYAMLPIQRGSYAQAARDVLVARLDAVYARLMARGNVRFALIPWELDSDPKRSTKYPAAEGMALESTEPFKDECSARAALMSRDEMFLANDTHLAPAGAAAMAECIAKLIGVAAARS